ncbi:MAG: hypothetical protein JWP12_3582 [Bacteroidetes bacterium]|nr:hypothetical protein [Bacteroidota bacterium]
MNHPYKQLFFSLLLLLFATGISAQVSDAKKDKIDALRTAFIAKKVALTDQESRAFWPLYNEMNDKLDANLKTFRLQYNANTNYNFATDKEAQAYLNAELLMKQKEVEIYKEYYDKFQKIMPVKKVAALRRAEEEFKIELIKYIKQN